MDKLENSNKRIAKNTIIVYVELFTTIVINLAMSRLVLQALGASDYGLYNVVGGIIAMFTFISSSMATTTIRFLNFEMGKPDGDTNRIFNQSNVLHLCFSVIIFFLLETIGIYYIINYLNVDAGKETDAMYVFQVSTIVACLGIMSVPYRSVFVAHERFSTIAFVNIFNALVKLAIAIALLYYSGNALRFYAVGMSITTFISFIVFYYLGSKNWPDIVKWRLVKDWRSYKEQLFYSNWNLLSTASLVGRNQGSALLINLFFGTVVNAAYAISVTVLHQVNHFVGKFDMAVAPQITQNLGRGNFDRSTYLASHTCRICILLMEIVFFPLYVELDYILHLWLGDNIPEGTLVFCQYTLLIAVISSTSGGLGQLINGTGKIKWFKIQMFVWNMLPLFISYLLFKWGYPPYLIVFLFVIGDIVNRFAQMYLLNRLFNFPMKQYIHDAYSRPGIVFCAMCFYAWVYSSIIKVNHYQHIAGFFLTIIVTVLICIVVGLYKNEKQRVFTLVKKKVNG